MAPPAAHPIRARFGRKKFDPQPTQRAAVLIAANGVKIPGAAIRQALRIAQGEPVAVVTIARIYGSAYGLPNAGLLPSKREMAEQSAIMNKAVKAIEKGGVEAWGQIAATRRPARVIAEAAVARQVRHVIVVREGQARWRDVIEGNLAKDVARRINGAVEVETVIA